MGGTFADEPKAKLERRLGEIFISLIYEGWVLIAVKDMIAFYSLLCVALRGEEYCFQSHTLTSRECQVEAIGSQNHVSLWHKELQELSSRRHRRPSVCISP